MPTANANRMMAGALALALAAFGFACARSVPTDSAPGQGANAPAPLPHAHATGQPPLPAPEPEAAAPDGDAAPATGRAEPIDGPHELPLTPERAIYFARPRADGSRAGPRPWRLVGHLHGMCYPPSYSCGRWLGAATDVGVLVCPTGNARCGDASVSPPSWEAPSWQELVATMDGDLERSIAKVEAKQPGSIRREGAVLTGFSRGAYAAPVIAQRHPGRWPYLVLIEANVPLTAASLRKAGVRAVALVAGELGNELPGMRKVHAELAQAGFPAALFVMPGVGHRYAEGMDGIMADALAFVLGDGTPDASSR